MVCGRGRTSRATALIGSLAGLLVMGALGGCDTDRNGEILAPAMFTEAGTDPIGLYREPNDNPATAVEFLPTDTAIAQTFHTPDDVDYFRFTAWADAPYIIRTKDLTPGLRTRIDILTATGDSTIKFAVGGSSENGASIIAWKPTATHQYLIKATSVASQDARTIRTGRYSVVVKLDDDEYEWSDAVQPTGLSTSGATITRTLNKYDDEDVFSFHAITGVSYRAIVSVDGPRAITIAVSAEDATGTVLASGTAYIMQATPFTVPADGDYILRVRPVDANELGIYRASVEPASDAWEPDGAIASAPVIDSSTAAAWISTADGIVQRHALTIGDGDYVAFPATAGSYYVVETDSLSTGVATRMVLSTSAGIVFLNDDADGDPVKSRIGWQAPVDLMCYVVVRPAPNARPGTYVLRIRKL